MTMSGCSGCTDAAAHLQRVPVSNVHGKGEFVHGKGDLAISTSGHHHGSEELAMTDLAWST